MSTCDIAKYEKSISIFEHFMTKFHELPKQPSYSCKFSITYNTPFLATQGVKQGDCLSPTLFNLFVDDIDHYFDKNISKLVSFDTIEFNHLLYADDLILSESAAGLQNCIDSLHTFCLDWCLNVNLNKTKAVINEEVK